MKIARLANPLGLAACIFLAACAASTPVPTLTQPVPSASPTMLATIPAPELQETGTPSVSPLTTHSLIIRLTIDGQGVTLNQASVVDTTPAVQSEGPGTLRFHMLDADGEWLGDATVWDPRETYVYSPAPSVNTGAIWSIDGKRALTWVNGEVIAWDASSGKQLAELEHDRPVGGAIWSPKGNQAVVWTDTQAAVWDMKAMERTFTLSDGQPVSGAVYHPDGTRLLVWGGTQARLFSMGNGLSQGTLSHPASIQGAFWPVGNQIVTWDGNSLFVWDAIKTEIVREIPVEGTLVGATASGNGLRMAYWSGSQVWIWSASDLANGNPLFTLPADHAYLGADLSDDGTRLLTWTESAATLWDLSGDQPLNLADIPSGSEIIGASLAGQGVDRVMIWSAEDIQVWDGETGSALTKFSFEAPMMGTAFSPVSDEKILGWTAGQVIQVTWSVEEDPDILSLVTDGKDESSVVESLVSLSDVQAELIFPYYPGVNNIEVYDEDDIQIGTLDLSGLEIPPN